MRARVSNIGDAAVPLDPGQGGARLRGHRMRRQCISPIRKPAIRVQSKHLPRQGRCHVAQSRLPGVAAPCAAQTRGNRAAGRARAVASRLSPFYLLASLFASASIALWGAQYAGWLDDALSDRAHLACARNAFRVHARGDGGVPLHRRAQLDGASDSYRWPARGLGGALARGPRPGADSLWSRRCGGNDGVSACRRDEHPPPAGQGAAAAETCSSSGFWWHWRGLSWRRISQSFTSRRFPRGLDCRRRSTSFSSS